jgi:large subunit ribosomal protein L40e
MAEKFTVFVHTILGQKIVIPRVQQPITVQELKLMIKDELGKSYADQCLIFGGVELEDNRWLSDYYIQNGSILQATEFRFRGGCAESERG